MMMGKKKEEGIERRGGRDGGGKCEVVAIRIKIIMIIIKIKIIILIMLVSRLLLDTANKPGIIIALLRTMNTHPSTLTGPPAKYYLLTANYFISG